MLRNMLDAAGKFKDLTKKTAKTIKKGAENISKKASEGAPDVSEVAKEATKEVAKEATKDTTKEAVKEVAKEATKEAFDPRKLSYEDLKNIDLDDPKIARKVKDYKAKEILRKKFRNKYKDFVIINKNVEEIDGKVLERADGESLVIGIGKKESGKLNKEAVESRLINMVDMEDEYEFINKRELYNPGPTTKQLLSKAEKIAEKREKQREEYFKNKSMDLIDKYDKGEINLNISRGPNVKNIKDTSNKEDFRSNIMIESPQQIMREEIRKNRKPLKSMVEDSPDGIGIGGLGMITGVTALSMIGMNHYNTKPQRRDNRRNNKNLYGGVSGIR